MENTTARENILGKIKQALAKPVPVPFPATETSRSIFTVPAQENAILFAENFGKLQGRFSFCADEKELVQQLQELISTRGWTKIYCRETALQNSLSAAGFSTIYADDVASCDAATATLKGQHDHDISNRACLDAKVRQGVD